MRSYFLDISLVYISWSVNSDIYDFLKKNKNKIALFLD